MNALITASIASLYAGPRPGTLEDEALCGVSAQVLEREEGWRRIRTSYRYEGWVRQEELTEDPALLRRWEEAPKLLVWQSCADILEEARVQGRCLATLVRGCLVEPLDQGPDEKGWRRVRLPDGRQGFTPGKFLLPPVPVGGVPEDEEAFREHVTKTALAYLGVQYRWGGRSPWGIDCSGLCFTAYYLNGVSIYRDAKILEGFPVHAIPAEQAKKGDLLFFPGHVAMYLGDGRFVHSTSHVGTHGVAVNSLTPGDPLFRPDLLETMTGAGSIF